MQPVFQRFPTFALRTCSKTFAFSDLQLQELQKLLTIYADLAAQTAPQQPAEQPTQQVPAAEPSPATEAPVEATQL